MNTKKLTLWDWVCVFFDGLSDVANGEVRYHTEKNRQIDDIESRVRAIEQQLDGKS